jgi:DnaJ family protein B protein 4
LFLVQTLQLSKINFLCLLNTLYPVIYYKCTLMLMRYLMNFQVLSDSQKRTVYDQLGEEGLKGQPPPGAGGPSASPFYPGSGHSTSFHFNPRSADDIFAEFFGFSGPFSSMGGMGGMGGMSGGTGGMRGDPRSYGSMFGNEFLSSQFGAQSSASHMPRPSHKPASIENRLPVTLADLYKGVAKKMKISREVIDATG